MSCGGAADWNDSLCMCYACGRAPTRVVRGEFAFVVLERVERVFGTLQEEVRGCGVGGLCLNLLPAMDLCTFKIAVRTCEM